jgi:hypothetical protein
MPTVLICAAIFALSCCIQAQVRIDAPVPCQDVLDVHAEWNQAVP